MKWMIVFALASCARDSEPPAQRKHEGSPKPSPTEKQPDKGSDDCPPPAAAPTTAPVVIAKDVVGLTMNMPLRWLGADGHVYELADDPRSPKDLGDGREFKGREWDEKYWYRTECFRDCDERTSMGLPKEIVRIDRVSGEMKRLSKEHYGISVVLPFREHVYWGIFGHQRDGGVWRVPKAGGAEELIHLAADKQREDKISALSSFPDGIIVQGTRTLGWIPVHGKPKKVFASENEVGPAVRDGNDFYIAEEGDLYWASKDSGFIHRVSADGTDTKLVGPVRWPSAIATYGADVFFMLRESGDVWSVPKAGGASHLAINGPRTAACDTALGMWADQRGLFWARGIDSLLRRETATIFFAPWSSLRSP